MRKAKEKIMTFFNKIGDTISSKSKEVATKAKELAEISNLNGQIETQKKIINQMYLEIGSKYYAAYREECEEKFPQQSQNINNASTAISQMTEQVQVLKKVQKCPNCNTGVLAESQFCANCGTNLVNTPPVQPIYASPEQPTYTETKKPINEAPVSEATKGEQVDKTSEVKNCAACGASLEDDAVFCPECGKKV